MFDTNENQGSQQAPEAQQSEATQAPTSVFDMPFEIQEEDDGIIPTGFDYGNLEGEEENQSQNSNDTNNPPAEGEAKKELNFDTPPQEEEGPQAQTQEEIIASLKEKGFEITAPGASTPNEDPRFTEINQLKNDIAQGNILLAMSEDELIKEKFTDNLKREYINQKKEHLIGSEEFNYELEAEIAELSENKFNKKIVADNVRRDISGYVTGKQNALTSVDNSIKEENNQRALENRTALQTQFKKFHEQGFMGVDIPQDIAKEVYQDVVTGAFNKKIKKDHNLVAQFALFTKLHESFAEKLGQPTYGEGVKAAFDQINKTGHQSARNPLAQMSASSAGNGNQGVGGINGRFNQASKKANGQENEGGNNVDGRF